MARYRICLGSQEKNNHINYFRYTDFGGIYTDIPPVATPLTCTGTVCTKCIISSVGVVECSSIQTHKWPGSRKVSRAELNESNVPGSLLSRGSHRRRPPFLKRYTIADFANTRAYQESTASLISASAEHGPFGRTHTAAYMWLEILRV